LLLAHRDPTSPHPSRRPRVGHRREPEHRLARTGRRGAARPLRALVQRVARASVTVDGTVKGAVGPGPLLLLGVTHTDTEADGDRLADKVRNLRIFSDADGRMNE